MVIPHLHFSGECYQAMNLYAKAFDATINKVIFIENGKPEKGILHAEMTIHGLRVMLNDNRSEICSADFPFVQLVVTFVNEEELKKSYEILKNENGIVSSMRETDYTPCTVGFWDKYGIRWSFMVD